MKSKALNSCQCAVLWPDAKNHKTYTKVKGSYHIKTALSAVFTLDDAVGEIAGYVYGCDDDFCYMGTQTACAVVDYFLILSRVCLRSHPAAPSSAEDAEQREGDRSSASPPSTSNAARS